MVLLFHFRNKTNNSPATGPISLSWRLLRLFLGYLTILDWRKKVVKKNLRSKPSQRTSRARCSRNPSPSPNDPVLLHDLLPCFHDHFLHRWLFHLPFRQLQRLSLSHFKARGCFTGIFTLPTCGQELGRKRYYLFNFRRIAFFCTTRIGVGSGLIMSGSSPLGKRLKCWKQEVNTAQELHFSV